MVIKVRGQEVGFGETVQLKVLFRNEFGVATDLDSTPSIQITDPYTVIYMDYTTIGVQHIATGTYAFNFTVPLNGPTGIWNDNWFGAMGGENVYGAFNFVVSNIALQGYVDGYEQLGDEPVESLSQTAIHNINTLMSRLKKRLQSSGWHMVKDEYGNNVRENCDIFNAQELYAFLCCSLSEFNSTPHFTGFVWEDDIVVEYRDVIIEGAYIMALASKALIEKGREFTISDNGLSFQAPAVADLLNSQMSTFLGPYREKLKYIKANMKPGPYGLGTLRITAVSPSILRLRHRREMQFPIQ